MSARKPIARMDSPATTTTSTDPIDEAPLEIAIAIETTISKTVNTENSDKTEKLTATAEEDNEEKTEETIKEDNNTSDEVDLIETQENEIETSTVTTSGTDAKRQTRNSPMLVGSPIKKKLSDSQEQDSSAESTSTVDESQKKVEKAPVGRPRKNPVEASAKTSSSPVPPSNRLTRKAAAQDWAANTRLTRARRTSVGMGARPETPPKRKYVAKKNIDPPAPAVKRKRSVSPKLSGDEPEVKNSKTDESDADFELNAVIVKQEVLESSEEMISDVASDITEPFPPEPTSRISLRARKSATCYSPTTRPYRREKDKEKSNAEAGSADAKRKRLSKVRPDEDSKDSLASSIMDEMGDLKGEEKFESEDASDITSSPIIETVANGAINKPLTVETESESQPAPEDTDTKSDAQMASTSGATSEKSNCSDKAASLSPDLVSEGISEISVKRFYKKPEFLENNLGIEKDPKLGEIVQNVVEKNDDAVDGLSVSNDSIKEGELVFEEEDDTSIGSIKNDNDEDGNSVSTGYISPLLVDEEEEDEEIHMSVNGDEKCEDSTNADEVKICKDVELEVDVLGEEAVEAPNEVPADNGSLGLKIDRVYENVKFETCDKTVGDMDEKDISTNEDDFKDRKAVEIAAVEKKELAKEEVVEKMDVDELKTEKTKVEDTKKEKTETDQEENKENVELVPETMKESSQDMTKTPEKDRVASMSADDQEESPTNSSKTQGETSGEGSTPSTSPQSAKSSSVPRTPENDERLRQKERHFKTLGLLTHKAADEAIMAKQKRRKFLHNLNGGSKKNTSTSNAAASAGSAAGNAQNKSSHEYTGTLKTVIKLNRQSGGGGSGVGSGGAAAGNGSTSEPKKGKNTDAGTKAATSGYGSRRQSLKMTFQKGRGRPANAEKSGEHPANVSGEDSYYTIQNEAEGTTAATTEASTSAATTASTTTTTTTHGRKSYNRSNTTNDATHQAEHSDAPSTSKKDEKEEILIPEKASSFKFHPGRLCQDQCYYCSGKFGLYDTPCHVGQIKSVERQQKILANEEKLTVDNCLCDACFRHVDRRANAPSYKKRLSAPGNIETARSNSNGEDTTNEQDKSQQQKANQASHSNGTNASAAHFCAVPGCGQKAPHSLRRKGIRKSIKKSVLNFDMSAAGTYLHLCEKHYEAVVQSSGCVLCKRRLGKNNMYHITTDTDKLEKALADMGIPVSLGQGTAVCKLCRYFANLLMKPPENGKVQKVEFVKNYKKRLLQFYNIHEKKDTSHEDDDQDEDKGKGKSPTKRQSTGSAGKRATRKSREPEDDGDEPMETTEPPPSPTPSSGSSVEMISDGGMYNADDSQQRSANKSSSSTVTSAEAAANASNQMVLDNDVMVDYDVPVISDSSSSASSKSTSPAPPRTKESKDQQSKLKAILQSVGTSLEDRSDISTVLRSNPNISMRELFPGEEDLGLQFKAPFGSSSAQRTPEGWTRINTFLQYDEPTRRLWEDLQKPYGNQSSFLRHLILLEKYYRNGDLILSSNASSNATVYTQTVRNRLTSYDSRSSASSSPTRDLECRSRSLSVDKIQRQLSSNSVTITARPKESKSQQKEDETSQQKEGGSTTGTSGATAPKSTPNSRSILKTNLLGVKGGAVEIVPLSASNSTSNSPHSSGSSTPNDNFLLTKQQKILAAANKLVSNKQETSTSQKKSAQNTTPPELISLNRRPVPALNSQQMKRPQLLLPKPMKSGKPIPPNVIVLPDTLTSQERLESKSWRPTLLPVTTTSHHLNNQQGPLYQTADGRRLPALVQVQSGGRPFLISIHDYNRMCILRREKLMRDQMLKGSKGKIKGVIFPPATCNSSSSGKVSAANTLQNISKTVQAAISAENVTKNQRLLMSKPTNFTPIAPKPTQATTSPPSTVTSSAAQQQQSQTQPTVILPAGTLQPISLLTTSQTSTLSPVPIFSGQVVPIINSSSSTATASSVSGIPTNSWLWNNFPDSNQMLMNGKASTAKESQATTTMKQQHSLLMSKIPKSLTVIPQHKLMPASAAAGTSGVVGNVSKE